MKFLLQIMLLILFPLMLSAQGAPIPVRIELETNPNIEPYWLIPMGENGLIIVLKTNEFEEKNNRLWVFSHYNTELELQWDFALPLHRNVDFQDYDSENHEVSILFYDPKTSSESNLQILSIDLINGISVLTNGLVDRRFDLTHFRRHRNYCYVGMNSRNSFKVYRFSILSDQAIDIQLHSQGGTLLESISIDTSNDQVVILTGVRDHRNRNALFLHRLNNEGQEVEFFPIMKDKQRKMITSVQFVNLNSKQNMVIGTFTDNPTRRSASVSFTEESKSTGFFRILIDAENHQHSEKFYRFNQLENIENYLRGPVAEKQRRSGIFSGSKTQDFEHYLVVHDIHQSNGQLFLSAEAFIPDFRTVTTVAYDYYGRPVPRNYSVFDGYRFSHTFVVAFSQDGDLLWDDGMEMINIRTFDLIPKVVLYDDDDGLTLAYSHDGKIAWKQLTMQKSFMTLSFANIDTSYSKDRVNNEQSSRLIHWYDQFFLASGYQTILNSSLPERDRRNVFYVNKIVFD